MRILSNGIDVHVGPILRMTLLLNVLSREAVVKVVALFTGP